MNDVDVVATAPKTPILLLKTRSVPHDGYEEYFETRQYAPTFVPVLEHTFDEVNLSLVRNLLTEKQIRHDGAQYGGMIFTSQRAVEAFSRLVELGRSTHDAGWPHLDTIPIYTVGPATSRALRAVSQEPPLQIFGEECGNGEVLAHFMLDHYGAWYSDVAVKPPLLFLVGEQRRDIIPKTLMNPALPTTRRIEVVELTVYGTGVMESFAQQFSDLLQATQSALVRWVVVFSPTGCEAMLRTLGLLDEASGRVKTGERGGGCGNRRTKGGRQTYIATIGPTTRDFLRKQLGFEPDVCAARPSAEGIEEGISKFMAEFGES